MNRRNQFLLVLALSVIPTVLHYATNPHNGPAHDIYQRLYYLPVIMASLWFGTRGGLITAVAIAVAYFPHALHGWHGPYSLFYRLMEVVMYIIVGGLTGWLSTRLRLATAAENAARLEAEQAYERLRAKTEELFALEEQLRRSDRLAALGQLTAGLAHEIRNPLASIKTSIEMLRAEDSRPRAPDAPDFYGIVLEETARLDRILSEFLQFARAEQSRPSDEPHFCSVASALQKTADLAQHRLATQGVRIEYDAASLNISVGVCESHLRQVFLNLLLNSMDAMPSGGVFHVRKCGEDGAHVTLEAEDTGPGIPPEVAPGIFNPFFSTKPHGTGLGLSIVERIIDSHGGRIELRAAARPSSCFAITLPRADRMPVP